MEMKKVLDFKDTKEYYYKCQEGTGKLTRNYTEGWLFVKNL